MYLNGIANDKYGCHYSMNDALTTPTCNVVQLSPFSPIPYPFLYSSQSSQPILELLPFHKVQLINCYFRFIIKASADTWPKRQRSSYFGIMSDIDDTVVCFHPWSLQVTSRVVLRINTNKAKVIGVSSHSSYFHLSGEYPKCRTICIFGETIQRKQII